MDDLAERKVTHPKSRAFCKIVEGEAEEFLAACQQLPPVVTALGVLVKQAFQAEYVFIQEGISQQKPASDFELGRLTEPVYSILRKIQEYREKNRADDYHNHLATIAESIAALSWITVPRTPTQFIRDMKEAGDYFGNRVLTTFKGNPQHATFINKWNATLSALEAYVKEHHLTGFEWGVLNSALRAMPPPPPPPPPTLDYGSGDAPNAPFDSQLDVDRQQLLAELNQGIGIVNILKPVTGRKNEKKSAPSAQLPTRVAQKSATSAVSHPPVFTLDGKKWRVEYQTNSNELKVTPNEKSESLAIYKCENGLVRTLGKMNAVTVDNCKKIFVVLDSIISSVELIRCNSVEIHCEGTCQNVTLDNCDSCQIFLTDASSNCEVITAKCTSTNICHINNGGYAEYPVPEQIRSKLNNNKLISNVVEHFM